MFPLPVGTKKNTCQACAPEARTTSLIACNVPTFAFVTVVLTCTDTRAFAIAFIALKALLYAPLVPRTAS
jgi:hypothetical protein